MSGQEFDDSDALPLKTPKPDKTAKLQQAVRRALRKRGYDIVRRGRAPDLNMFLDVHKVDLILDVGANEGQFRHDIKKWGYDGRLWSFEPTQRAYAVMKRNAQGDKDWKVFKTAVGDFTGHIDINISELDVFSSVKKITPEAIAFDSRSRIAKTETVRIDTLDNLARDAVGNAIFVKIDTQGFEKEVLDGAVETLKRVIGVSLELPTTPLYQDNWSLIDAISRMDRLGFTPAQFNMVTPLRDDPASSIEFDCVFRRK